MVGCVIVKDGEIVGEGFHPKAGQPHAEVFALRDAGELAENATAYVSLEPCNHFGRTPPCSEALIKAKVKKVVVGMVDPNPIVASRGVAKLRDAGIDVTVVEEELCKKLNEAWIHQMLTGKPFVTLRYAACQLMRLFPFSGHTFD
ncbi:cytidine/deoxycytidylate deaminase family protein [Artemisia annua]|uniref:diaminohydroxyphosphoribosylaminopyrimidine deaminase n=1 Tax=Artemisia annua TaxID=35608 RepID=A0A2U1PQA9_ARTAN|nr:cytidine/deoxycytidylate deaminase family protein [Artemisia annua]